MHALLKTIICLAASLALYVAVFATMASKPITMGVMHDLYSYKIAYARSIERPKIVISAGSSGLYGIRCELIERSHGIPCVNMAINKEMGMHGILTFAKRAARPGDLVLLPLEYGVYAGGGYGSTLRQYAIAYDREMLHDLPVERQVWSAFYFDLKWLFASIAENWMYHVAGERHPLQEVEVLTRQGDLRGHTPEKGYRYLADLHEQEPGTTYMPSISPQSTALPILHDFLDWAAANRIRVIGTFPPNVNTGEIDEGALRVIRDTYVREGHEFAELENRGLYPIGCFYDTPNHLNEACQAAHTRLVVSALQSLLPAGVSGSLHARLPGDRHPLH